MGLLPKVLCLLALAACAQMAHAQTHIYHCIGAHGEPVFSGQPCGPSAPPTSQSAAAQSGGFGSVCAGSPRELEAGIAQAFATHDVNRFAGLILWRGMSQASAQAMLHAFAAWLKQPLSGIAVTSAAGAPLADMGPPSAGDPATGSSAGAMPNAITGFEISTGGDDGRSRDFGVTEFGGCWWLTF